jgi:parallel beta-helix repeat protein
VSGAAPGEALMHVFRSLLISIVMLGAVVGTAAHAPAAESYDSCGSNYIDAVPIVISTPGTWCLRHNVLTNATNIRAVDIRTGNVTIDCNGFRLSDIQAGATTLSNGIVTNGAFSNITVRNCTIIGFSFGIFISGNPPGSGHIIENNLISSNRAAGIRVDGGASIVRHNIVTNTGGQPGSANGMGIIVNGSVDVIDNVVDGIAGDGSVAFSPYGIFAGDNLAVGSLIRGNRIRNLAPSGGGSSAAGIYVWGTGFWVRDNLVGQQSSTNGIGISCSTETRVRDNIVKNYTQGMAGQCDNDSGNISY